jgi:hypothetical protein
MSAGEFEGVHEGHRRGSGAVIIWDEGTAAIVRDEPGHISFVLNGGKLSGGFALTRTGEKRWILVKVRDEQARPGSDIVAARPESIRSGKTWQELREQQETPQMPLTARPEGPRRIAIGLRCRPPPRPRGRGGGLISLLKALSHRVYADRKGAGARGAAAEYCAGGRSPRWDRQNQWDPHAGAADLKPGCKSPSGLPAGNSNNEFNFSAYDKTARRLARCRRHTGSYRSASAEPKPGQERGFAIGAAKSAMWWKTQRWPISSRFLADWLSLPGSLSGRPRDHPACWPGRRP